MSLDDDAHVFGQHFQGGWQLGLLVARNVHKQAGAGRPSKSEPVRNKVAPANFADKAGVSERTVQWYRNAWARAAEDGHCTPADELSPGDDDPKLSGLDLDSHDSVSCGVSTTAKRDPTMAAAQEVRRQHTTG
jgi:hypothetical protein